MIFEINNENSESKLSPVISSDFLKELELEALLVRQEEEAPLILSEAIFGEPLLLLSNQVRTRSNKKADILALDRRGNGVVIELKRDKGRLGVDTQALQYLADFSAYKGKNFLRKFVKKGSALEEQLNQFLDYDIEHDEINRSSRIVLMARAFDTTLFSMGEWLSSKGVSFRCIAYTSVEIEERQFISFSVVFDRNEGSIFPLSFSSNMREPGYFWHNIARVDETWWKKLVDKKQIPACFNDSPGDQGEAVLNKYIPGDIVIAYVKGRGALGWGKVANPLKYKLVPEGEDEDFAPGGGCRHRLSVNWEKTVTRFADGVKPDFIRREFDIYHPISTSVQIDPTKAKRLIDYLDNSLL